MEFSFLVSEMRAGIENRLEGRDPMIARLALGEAYAAQITNSFFAICEREADLDEEEKQVGICLKNEVHAVIKERNDIAHGDWSIDWWDASAARLRRTKPGRRSGAWIEKVRPAAELDALTDEMEILTEKVIEFAWLCFGIHPLTRFKEMDVRVRDIYRFQKHKGALRKGRYAEVRIWDDGDERDGRPTR
ncbi:MAG: hypothetical protein M3Y75_11090 [Actinomycetota bacterium]|nr:hypothetical protein [Actinomycetota bacterium]